MLEVRAVARAQLHFRLRREAPAMGRTIFHHDPEGAGAADYLSLADEVSSRLDLKGTQVPVSIEAGSEVQDSTNPALRLVSEVNHG